MRTLKYFTLFIIASLLVSSCIDEDYNWDNINKEGSFNIGTVAFGDIEELSVESLLSDELRAQLQVRSDGVYYLEYDGTLDIEKPNPEVPETPVVAIQTIRFPYPEVSTPLLSGDKLPVVEGDLVSYTISEPYFAEDNWEVEVESVTFQNCDFIMEINLTGLQFEDTGSKPAQVEIEVRFPDNIALSGSDSRIYKASAKLKDLKNGQFVFAPAKLASFDYLGEVQDLIYSVSIIGGNSTKLNTANGEFLFDLKFRTENVVPDVIYGEASFNEPTAGMINDLKEFGEAFTNNDIINFEDIDFYLDLTTNLGADFNIRVDKLTSIRSTDKVSLLDVTKDGLNITQPALNKTKTSSFVLAKQKPDTDAVFIETDITPLFGLIPTAIEYNVSISNASARNKKAFFPYGRLVIDADYRINVPFCFSDLNISLADTLDNVFSEDLAEMLFSKPGEFNILADHAIVNIGKEDDALDLQMGVSLLDENYNAIDVEVQPAQLSNGDAPAEIKVIIKDSDIAKLADVKHMSFDFIIAVKDGKKLSLRKTDTIAVNGLKFQSTSGIKYDF